MNELEFIEIIDMQLIDDPLLWPHCAIGAGHGADVLAGWNWFPLCSIGHLIDVSNGKGYRSQKHSAATQDEANFAPNTLTGLLMSSV